MSEKILTVQCGHCGAQVDVPANYRNAVTESEGYVEKQESQPAGAAPKEETNQERLARTDPLRGHGGQNTSAEGDVSTTGVYSDEIQGATPKQVHEGEVMQDAAQHGSAVPQAAVLNDRVEHGDLAEAHEKAEHQADEIAAGNDKPESIEHGGAPGATQSAGEFPGAPKSGADSIRIGTPEAQ